MQRVEGKIPSTCGLTDLHTVLWLPEGEPVGVVQIVHGMQEYLLRYDYMAQRLCERGFAVCGHDHLGHGGSLIDGTPGYFGEEHPTDTLVADIHAVRQAFEKRFPGVPYFIFGHSMGSFLTRVYLTEHAAGLSGAIICGTSGPVPGAGLVRRYLRLLWKIHGGRYVDRRLADAVSARSNRRFASEGRNAWLSRVPQVHEEYNADPQTQFYFSVSALWVLMDSLCRISRRDWAEKLPQALPILLTSGADDPIGQFGDGVREVYDRMMRRGFDDLDIKLYYDCRHELANEENRDEIIADWAAWLEEKI